MIKIAIIDDAHLFRQGMNAMLEKVGFVEVWGEASTGTEFFEKLYKSETIPDIAIIDIEMPTMDGIQVCEEILNKNLSIKTLIISNHDSSQYIEKTLKRGAMGYMLKNARLPELKEAILTLYENNFYFNDLLPDQTKVDLVKQNKTKPRFIEQAKLSPQEKEVVMHICAGLMYKEIAVKMEISKRTVETYRDRICDKLGVRKINDIIIYAAKKGWV